MIDDPLSGKKIKDRNGYGRVDYGVDLRQGKNFHIFHIKTVQELSVNLMSAGEFLDGLDVKISTFSTSRPSRNSPALIRFTVLIVCTNGR